MADYKKYAPAVLRMGVASLMLWFGLTNIFQPEVLVGYLPRWATSLIPLNPITFMVINGVVEVTLGVALLIGFLTRISAFIVMLHTFGIAISIGYSDVAIRDYVLAIAALAVFLYGPDEKTMDVRYRG